MYKVNLFFLICLISACGSYIEHGEYSYSELVEIFAVSTYLSDKKEIQKFIDDKYGLANYNNQIFYRKSIEDKVGTQKKWNKFVKDTIEYYIKLNRKYNVKYYTLQGYNRKLDRFNDNYTLDIKKKGYTIYWKIYFWVKKNKRIALIREQYKNDKLFFRTYYDENRKKVKEEYLQRGKSSKIRYYFHGSLLG